MLPGEIIPRHEQSLHSRMMAQALGMSVCQAGEPPKRHPHREVEPLDMRSAYPIFIAITEHWQLFDVGYLGRRVASGFLGTGVILY